MKRRRWRKSNETPPVGEARRSQLLTTYGAGSMIDLVDRSILVAGLDFWNYPAERPVIQEPRLSARLVMQFRKAGRALNPMATFSPPPACDDREPSEKAGLQVVEFPRWMVCQACRQLVQASSSLKVVDGRYHHACAPKQDVLVPVRFVVMCAKGHLEEFPWSSFVHDGAACSSVALTMTEDAGAELFDVRVTCVACEASRTMDQAEQFVKSSPCRGSRPWLGRASDVAESCDAELTMKVRTSSSTYFGVAASALSIPNAADRLEGLVKKHLPILNEAGREDLASLLRLVPPVKADLGGYSVEQVWGVLDAVRRGEPAPSQPLRETEYAFVQGVPVERPGDAPSDEEQAASFFARRLGRKQALPAGIDRVVLVRQLREVHAQVGFSRLAPIDAEMDGDVDVDIAHLGHMTDWLPAIENRGEGLWIQLDEARLAAWERHAIVQRRSDALRAGWQRELSGRGLAFFGARYYLLHSLSHLLIQAIALECGYGASSLRERIYCSRPGASSPMAAILLVTTTPGSEGTLGGLVAQGRRIDVHLERALSLARLCSNDPVCAGHAPNDDHGDHHLEGAACHGCLYLAEVSCERMNRMLDRALVVPIIDQPPELAFFGDPA